MISKSKLIMYSLLQQEVKHTCMFPYIRKGCSCSIAAFNLSRWALPFGGEFAPPGQVTPSIESRDLLRPHLLLIDQVPTFKKEMQEDKSGKCAFMLSNLIRQSRQFISRPKGHFR